MQVFDLELFKQGCNAVSETGDKYLFVTSCKALDGNERIVARNTSTNEIFEYYLNGVSETGDDLYGMEEFYGEWPMDCPVVLQEPHGSSHRHFAGVDKNNNVYVWAAGRTSHTTAAKVKVGENMGINKVGHYE